MRLAAVSLAGASLCQLVIRSKKQFNRSYKIVPVWPELTERFTKWIHSNGEKSSTSKVKHVLLQVTETTQDLLLAANRGLKRRCFSKCECKLN